MKITILDGGTTNPGDVSWDAITAIGDTEIYDNTTKELVVLRGKDADALIMNRIVMTREIMESLPKLKYIGTLSTGYNTIDLNAAKALGITVCNVPLYCAPTVAQQAFALLLELCNHISAHSDAVKENRWEIRLFK